MSIAWRKDSGKERNWASGDSIGQRDKSSGRSTNGLKQKRKSNYTNQLLSGDSYDKKRRKNR